MRGTISLDWVLNTIEWIKIMSSSNLRAKREETLITFPHSSWEATLPQDQRLTLEDGLLHLQSSILQSYFNKFSTPSSLPASPSWSITPSFPCPVARQLLIQPLCRKHLPLKNSVSRLEPIMRAEAHNMFLK